MSDGNQWAVGSEQWAVGGGQSEARAWDSCS
jgi:hypothetical protein